jgi:catechol 2,3-dioxygenase-like lactoylglutathione lyase family enzyme
MKARPALDGNPIGRLHHIVVDCPAPTALASFYSVLLGLPVTFRSEDWVVIAANETASGIAFQQAEDFQAPKWPDSRYPQQFHLDVMVEDLEEAERRVLECGASKLSDDHVYADPAGHPFCLIPRPVWAPPIRQSP